jgi:8-hydroxy-5-deazaflavin:NADPH oxidoreductase
MNIGILGSGVVGKTLAAGFEKHGYQVMIGTRKDTVEHFKTGSFRDAAAFGEIIVLAVKGTAAKEVLKMAGNIDGKIIIDATNPIAEAPPENGVLKFFTTLDHSLMEQLQQAHPNAKLVKAFSSIGAPFMVNPPFDHPTMFICGNDEHAKQEVAKILKQFGFAPEDMGKVEAARAIEPLCILWCIPGLLHNKWNHAFKLLKS